MGSARARLFLALVTLAVALGAGLMLLGGRSDRPSRAPEPEQRALGRAVYAEHCSACHGADLEGQPNWRVRGPDGLLPAPPHDQSGHTWHHPDAQLFRMTKFGIAALAGPGYDSAMGGFGKVLSDKEIWAVLVYIKSRWPEDVRRRQAEITARAAQAD